MFRMVVFRPFTSEVVVAKVKSSDEDGIRCMSLFFCSQSTAYYPVVYSNGRILRRHVYTSRVSPSTIRIVRLLSLFPPPN